MYLITVEGGDGSGKGEAVRILTELLAYYPFNEVHRSNMAKLVDGKVIRREDGKVLKPEGWQPPQLAQFLQ